MDQIRDVVIAHITAEFLDGDTGNVSLGDANLIEAEVIDSLGIFLLVSFLQERFGIEIHEEEVNIDNFSTVESIASLVAAKQAAS